MCINVFDGNIFYNILYFVVRGHSVWNLAKAHSTCRHLSTWPTATIELFLARICRAWMSLAEHPRLTSSMTVLSTQRTTSNGGHGTVSKCVQAFRLEAALSLTLQQLLFSVPLISSRPEGWSCRHVRNGSSSCRGWVRAGKLYPGGLWCKVRAPCMTRSSVGNRRLSTRTTVVLTGSHW